MPDTIRGWGAIHPRARYCDPLPVAAVLASDLVASPLHKLDC